MAMWYKIELRRMLVGEDHGSAFLMMFMGVFLRRAMPVESLEMRHREFSFLCEVDNDVV